MVSEVKYTKELERMNIGHDFLENEIENLMRCKVIDQFRLNDLKKKKLRAKEAISVLKDNLYANLTA